MSNNKLTKKEKFDTVIKKNLISLGISENAFTYSITQKDEKISEYSLYFNKAEFDAFVKEMETLYLKHFLKYRGGAGSELVEKNGRYGLTPPKMASVASSSRFCYLALRNGTDALVENKYISGNDIEFEKECRIFTDSPTAPQLDAFIEDAECNIYIEAKCHEIFDSHNVKLKNKYWEYFENNEVLHTALEKTQKGEEEFELPLSLFGIDKRSSRFDIKQLICHLLGIKEQNKGKKSKLIYLFFEPKADNKEDTDLINKVFKDLTAEIESIFDSDIIKRFCDDNNIELIAIKENSRIMEPLDLSNISYIYPKKK